MKRRLAALVALAIAVAFAPAWADSLSLPARAFPVEGGWIAVQGGVMKNQDFPPGPFGKLRYPIRYFLSIGNETASPIRLEVEWRLPDDKPKRTNAKVLDPGKRWSFWLNKFDLIAGAIPFRIQVFADEAGKVLGTVDTEMHFTEDEREFIRRYFKDTTTNFVLAGWPEMKGAPQEVPGTSARGNVLVAIQHLLWKEESKRLVDCEHRAVRAESFEPKVSATLPNLPEGSRKSAEEARTRGDLKFERWLMRSCSNLTTYEVLMVTDQFDETDIRAERLDETMTEQAPLGAAAASASPPAPSPPPTSTGPVIPEPAAPAKGPFDSRAWREGYAARTPQMEITEYVLPGEVVEAWTELVTVQRMPGAAERMTPQESMNGARKATLEQCPSTTWTVLRQEKEEVLYQWEHRKCRGFADQFEVAKKYRDGSALVRVSWVTKKLPVTEETRASWIKIIGEYPGEKAASPLP